MPTYLIVLLVVLAVVLLALLAWLKWRPSNQTAPEPQPTDPRTLVRRPSIVERAQTELHAWEAMGVPYNEVAAMQGTFPSLTPQSLQIDTERVNKALESNGYAFSVTPHQVLGLMLNYHVATKIKGRRVTMLDVAIWWWAEYSIRQEKKMCSDEPIKHEYLKERVEWLVQNAHANMLNAAQGQLPPRTEEHSIAPTARPLAAQSIKELIEKEATFQVHRKLKLKSGDELPPDAEIHLEEARKIAWEKYRKTHGLEEEST